MTGSEMIELVVSAQAGDHQAFEELYERSKSAVYARAYKLLRNSDDAQDLTQEVFSAVLRKLPQLRDPAHFIGWLMRIVHRLGINHLTRHMSGRRSISEPLNMIPDKGPSVHEDVSTAEAREQARVALTKLNPLDRDTLVAHYLRGLDLKQMAQEFGVPIGTIKRRLFDARRRLEQVLGRPDPQLAGRLAGRPDRPKRPRRPKRQRELVTV